MTTMPNDCPGAPAPAEVQAQMRQWRAAHPTASFAEIEAATDRHLASLRTAVIQEAAHAGAATARPDGPACATPMQRVGQRQRTVRTTQHEPVTVRGPGYRCPACGAGLFPPGGGVGTRR